LWVRPKAAIIKGQTNNKGEKMSNNNPYVQTLIEMGYDKQDCLNVAAAGQSATYPRTIYNRTFETEAEYNEAIADFLNGL
jgi:hypothetical protein